MEFDHVGFIAVHADFRELYAVLCHVINVCHDEHLIVGSLDVSACVFWQSLFRAALRQLDEPVKRHLCAVSMCTSRDFEGSKGLVNADGDEV